MTALCHPIPADAAQDFLALAARALCDRPDETPAQRASRTRQMVHTALGFEPRDGLEYMLATLIQGQFHLILSTMGELLQNQAATPNPRALSSIAALNRSFLGLLRESRTARKRPVEAEPATAPTAAAPQDTAPSPAPERTAPSPAAPSPATPTTATPSPSPSLSPAPAPEPAAPSPAAKHPPAFPKTAPDRTNILSREDFPPAAPPNLAALHHAHTAANGMRAETAHPRI